MAYAPLSYTALFIISHLLSEILRIPGNSRRRDIENFYFFVFRKLKEKPPPKSKILRKDL